MLKDKIKKRQLVRQKTIYQNHSLITAVYYWCWLKEITDNKNEGICKRLIKVHLGDAISQLRHFREIIMWTAGHITHPHIRHKGCWL